MGVEPTESVGVDLSDICDPYLSTRDREREINDSWIEYIQLETFVGENFCEFVKLALM